MLNLSRSNGTSHAAAVIAVVTLGCAAFGTRLLGAQAAVAGHQAPSLLVPGSSILQPPALRDTSWRTSVLVRKTGSDTAEHAMAANQHTQHPIPGKAEQVVLTSRWDPPFTSIDTMVFNRNGLVPETERLVYTGNRTYRYAGNRVTGAIEVPDSAPRAFDRTFAQNVFAFNEVDLLARSLPFRAGATFVVPLFSEVDTDVEMDTLTVVGPDSTAKGASQWVVRFADPAIVSLYVVDPTSRATVSLQTTQRRTGSRLRYVSAP